MEGTFDERPVAAKERKEHFFSLPGQGYRFHTAVASALLAADKPLLVQTIHGHADRSWIEVHSRSNGIHRHRSLMEQYFEDTKIRFP